MMARPAGPSYHSKLLRLAIRCRLDTAARPSYPDNPRLHATRRVGLVFRTVVTILTALLMLMPPGMCVCQFTPVRPVCPPPMGRTVATARDEERSSKCSSCCSRSNPKAPVGGGERAAADRDHGPRPNLPHDPGCPALKTVDWSKIAGTFASADALMVPALSGALFGLAASPVTPSRPADSLLTGHAPIYITFRTLLI